MSYFRTMIQESFHNIRLGRIEEVGGGTYESVERRIKQTFIKDSFRELGGSCKLS